MNNQLLDKEESYTIVLDGPQRQRACNVHTSAGRRRSSESSKTRAFSTSLGALSPHSSVSYCVLQGQARFSFRQEIIAAQQL